MISRRTLLQSALAPFALGAAHAAKTCGFNDVRSLDQTFVSLQPALPASAPHFTNPHMTPLERPLWSNLVCSGRANSYLETLRSAYLQMKAVSNHTDPTSLTYQAWLHWRLCPDGMLDTVQRQDIHGASGFLPWHRAYLFFFERLIQHFTTPSFRLAVWDWENVSYPTGYEHPDLLPVFSGCNFDRGAVQSPVKPDNLTGWLNSNKSTDFLGTKTGPGNAVAYAHDDVHRYAGMVMRAIPVAALDPLFFAHHANVDRYWDYWYRYYDSAGGSFFANQTYPDGSWPFYDALSKSYVSVTPDMMLSIDGLGYSYTSPTVPVYEFETRTLIGDAQLNLALPIDVLLNRIKSKSPQFSLPLITQFPMHQGGRPVTYKVFLIVGSKRILIGELHSGSHMHTGEKLFSSLKRDDLVAALSAAKLQIETQPKMHNPAFTLLLEYPATEHGWDSL